MRYVILFLLFCTLVFGQINIPGTSNNYYLTTTKASAANNAGGTLLSVSGAGYLANIRCYQSSVPTGVGLAAIDLNITMDGHLNTFHLFALGGTTWLTNVTPFAGLPTMTGLDKDYFILPVNLSFGTSLLIALQGGGNGESGSLVCGITLGVKI